MINSVKLQSLENIGKFDIVFQFEGAGACPEEVCPRVAPCEPLRYPTQTQVPVDPKKAAPTECDGKDRRFPHIPVSQGSVLCCETVW